MTGVQLLQYYCKFIETTKEYSIRQEKYFT